MRFQVIEAAQRSPEWFQARAGRVTGSRAADVLAKIRTGEAAARRDYRVQLAVERLIGQPQEDGYTNAAMQWGIDHEDEAVSAYESESGAIVRRTGFLRMAEHEAGCSLDGDLENFAGILEVKCPKSAIHVGYLKAARLPPEYVPQITHNLWVTGSDYADFVSWDPRLPEGLRYFCVRVFRNELDIKGYEAEISQFLKEVQAEVETLTKLRK